MILHHTKLKLVALGASVVQATQDTTNLSRQYFMRQIMLVDPDLIAIYVAAELSNPNYRSETNESAIVIRRGETNLSERMQIYLRKSIMSNPTNRNAFTIITRILDGYFDDLIKSNEDQNDDISIIAERLQTQNREGSLMSELLPQMMYLDGRVDINPNETNIADALKSAFEANVFGEGIECPFGRKISSIFALQPVRISPTKVIIHNEKRRGSLPVFISRELSQSATITTPHLLLAAT